MSTPLVHCIAYVRLPTGKPAASAHFASEICGLERNDTPQGDPGFRIDARFRALVFLPQPDAEASLGIELRDEAAFGRAVEALRSAGIAYAIADADACAAREVRGAILTRDPSGNAIELVLGPRLTARRFFPTRDCGVVGLQGAGLRSTDLSADTRFWCDLFGASVADRVGDITYIRMDEMHHRLALYPSASAGLLNVVLEVESLDLLMQNYYFMGQRQVRVLQGPGRNVASGEAFLHLAGPEGLIITFATEMTRNGAAPRRARQFAPNPEGLCAWGSTCLDVAEFSGATPSHWKRRSL